MHPDMRPAPPVDSASREIRTAMIRMTFQLCLYHVLPRIHLVDPIPSVVIAVYFLYSAQNPKMNRE